MSTFIELIQSTFTKIQGKIPVRGTLTTPSGSETFPIVICNEVMGGMFVVNHIDELSSIPLERLLKGCKCVVNEFTGDDGKQIPTTTYQLNRMPQESDFTELPVLGQTFIEENPPIDRISVVTNEPEFRMDGYLKLKTVRPMPVYSVPGLIDHF